MDLSVPQHGALASPTDQSVTPVPCGGPLLWGYLIGAREEKEIVAVERNPRSTTLRWFDVRRKKVRREIKVGLQDKFLGGSDATSDGGNGVVVGAQALFPNAAGTLRRYPERTTLPTQVIDGMYLPDIGRGVLDFGSTKLAAERVADGVVYRPFILGQDRDLVLRPRNLRRIWASPHWVLRALGPYPSLWMVSAPDGSDERFLAYGRLTACGQPLMGDHALNLVSDQGHRVVALSLRQDRDDYAVARIPLDRTYCVAGERGTIAVTGRYQDHPAVAIYQDGVWQRVLLPDGPSVLEPLVHEGRILVSAPEEKASSAAHVRIDSVGAVYVLAREGQDWRARTKIVPAVARKHSLFGYRVVPLGHRIFINFLADYPPGRRENGLGYPVVCEAKL